MFFRPGKNEVLLSEETDDNTLIIKDFEYELTELYEGSKTGKGGNSAVYLATPLHGEVDEFVVKFCRFPITPLNRSHRKRIKRFKHEVEALKKARRSEASPHVISLISGGTMKIPSRSKRKRSVTVAYYVMEKADCDLASYTYQNSLSLDKKLNLFIELADSLSKLHSIGIRHRDLKPDNVFICDDKIKLGDLGLIEDLDREYTIDGLAEKIGPFGYMSPEAMNKALADRSRISDQDTIIICEKSDIFQLGLILFYLVQGEVPMGCIKPEDFSKDWDDIPGSVENIIKMLQFRKNRRIQLETLQEAFTL